MTPTGYLASGYPPSPPTFPPPPTVSAGVELYQSYLDSGRFLIALGNHDWHDENAQAAKVYFGQQGHLGEGGQGRISAGPIELLPVESNGASCASCGGPHPDPAMQAVSPGLMAQRAAVVEPRRNSPACWKMLCMHHPAHTTSQRHESPNPIVEQFVQAVERRPPAKSMRCWPATSTPSNTCGCRAKRVALKCMEPAGWVLCKRLYYADFGCVFDRFNYPCYIQVRHNGGPQNLVCDGYGTNPFVQTWCCSCQPSHIRDVQ